MILISINLLFDHLGNYKKKKRYDYVYDPIPKYEIKSIKYFDEEEHIYKTRNVRIVKLKKISKSQNKYNPFTSYSNKRLKLLKGNGFYNQINDKWIYYLNEHKLFKYHQFWKLI